jgi:DNA-binding XRE family transcriptional regulator
MKQRGRLGKSLGFAAVELGGVSYAILPAALLLQVCRRAGVRAVARGNPAPSPLDAAPEEWNGPNVARRIADRRKHAGLTQAALARLAGVRIETVNRIERGKVTPDFRTIRKLVHAMLHAEKERSEVSATRKEQVNVSSGK